ncbi:DUF7322 domain-containing protein [Halobellus ruber]|uniref:DUF7322 domain-containing protein n=1 Tax=Halobellus ruber TaxID=2761102 RepID=A0A7J9SFV3_9EURY|nr:hypothetical protein [Halobellus ruber]MBB6645820.1 hypothetical protein [Halobellus ruber]
MPSRFDEWPDEPDEPDPEARWDSPEDDLVSIPSVEDGDPDAEGAGIEVDGEVAKFFWVSVIYANVALGGVAVGLLLVGFRGRVTVGAIAVAVGLLALYRTYDVYRRYREHVGESNEAGEAERGSDPDTGAEGADDGSG